MVTTAARRFSSTPFIGLESSSKSVLNNIHKTSPNESILLEKVERYSNQLNNSSNIAQKEALIIKASETHPEIAKHLAYRLSVNVDAEKHPYLSAYANPKLYTIEQMENMVIKAFEANQIDKANSLIKQASTIGTRDVNADETGKRLEKTKDEFNKSNTDISQDKEAFPQASNESVIDLSTNFLPNDEAIAQNINIQKMKIILLNQFASNAESIITQNDETKDKG